jgi:hypothetical protein
VTGAGIVGAGVVTGGEGVVAAEVATGGAGVVAAGAGSAVFAGAELSFGDGAR